LDEGRIQEVQVGVAVALYFRLGREQRIDAEVDLEVTCY